LGFEVILVAVLLLLLLKKSFLLFSHGRKFWNFFLSLLIGPAQIIKIKKKYLIKTK